MFDNTLISMHKEREKQIHDAWVSSKGVKVNITPVSVIDNEGSLIVHDNDPMNIDIDYLDYSGGTVTKFEEPFFRYAVLLNENYEQTSISYEIMINEAKNSADIDNHNELYCYISGELIPKYSIVEFSMYKNIKMRVEEVLKKRPISDIMLYRLTRY